MRERETETEAERQRQRQRDAEREKQVGSPIIVLARKRRVPQGGG